MQNDSVAEISQAIIVGDFVAGERAGVQLTSPCDGTIVAVQLFWLEGTPGHGQSLEQAIYIYAGDSFPTPGTLLETLDGPLLTPGYLNEFRYLDEAQTIPLNVPIVAGQQFYVVLEFLNATDVGNGGPSIVRDLNGCQPGRNVLYTPSSGWLNFCLFLQGDLAIRAVVDCSGPTGACCLDETCVPAQTEAQCVDAGGSWGGAGSTCEDNNGNGVPDVCEQGCPNPGNSGVYCTADLANNDCVVEWTDLQTLLAAYGNCPGDTDYNADANIADDDDDCITLADLQALLAQYGDDCN